MNNNFHQPIHLNLSFQTVEKIL